MIPNSEELIKKIQSLCKESHSIEAIIEALTSSGYSFSEPELDLVKSIVSSYCNN